MIRFALLALALPLAACGGDSTADASANDAATVTTGSASSAPTAPADPEAANAGMSRDSLLTSRERLEDALSRYQQIEGAGGWGTIPDGDLVEPGDTAAAQVQALRDRLAATDELGRADAQGEVFDMELASALAQFQARNGLSVDSLLGGNTRQALNASAGDRVAQIQATLARWDELSAFPDGAGRALRDRQRA